MKACINICQKSTIEEDRCDCVNHCKANNLVDVGIGAVIVSFNYCSKEERNELIKYLEDNSWDFEETSIFK